MGFFCCYLLVLIFYLYYGHTTIIHIQHLIKIQQLVLQSYHYPHPTLTKTQQYLSMSNLILISLILVIEGLERPFKYNSNKISKKSQFLNLLFKALKCTIFLHLGHCSVK